MSLHLVESHELSPEQILHGIKIAAEQYFWNRIKHFMDEDWKKAKEILKRLGNLAPSDQDIKGKAEKVYQGRLADLKLADWYEAKKQLSIRGVTSPTGEQIDLVAKNIYLAKEQLQRDLDWIIAENDAATMQAVLQPD